jgi:hypothetical protein
MDIQQQVAAPAQESNVDSQAAIWMTFMGAGRCAVREGILLWGVAGITEGRYGGRCIYF